MSLTDEGVVYMADLVLKERSAFFCNLKALLIFLVVYGHLIETRLYDSSLLMWLYRMIYAVHMPLFAFLSGMFLKEAKACMAQMKSTLCSYIVFQLLYLAAARRLGECFFIPYWHLWYLLSLSCWAGICLLFCIWLPSDAEKSGYEFQRRLDKYGRHDKFPARLVETILIVLCVAAACAAGNVEWIGREFSCHARSFFCGLHISVPGEYALLALDDDNTMIHLADYVEITFSKIEN